MYNMKIKDINTIIKWQTIRQNFNGLDIDIPFPSYNIKIKHNDTIIEELNNLKEYIYTEDQYFLNYLESKKPKYFSQKSQNKIDAQYTFHFAKNYKIYKEKFNKLGFFKNIKLIVDYNNTQEIDYEFDLEYPDIENINNNLLFNKIYRSNDYLSIKFLINKIYLEEKEVDSILIMSEAYVNSQNKKLKNLLVKEIKKQWLDVNEENALLTIPFVENEIVEVCNNINIKIIPLNLLQTQIYEFLKSRETEEDINLMFLDFFNNQVLDFGKIYKQPVNMDTLIVYQNYLYLFNKESISNSLRSINIKEVVFDQYYPLLNKDDLNKTIYLSSDFSESSSINEQFEINKDFIGYYNKEQIKYYDSLNDIQYLQTQGIQKCSIAEVIEENSICNLYLEFITNFYQNENFYIETSSNIKLDKKYRKNINNKEYITFLFKYSYNLNDINQYLLDNPNVKKSQIVLNKNIINFSAKILL